jgi:hypothetical protein
VLVGYAGGMDLSAFLSISFVSFHTNVSVDYQSLVDPGQIKATNQADDGGDA